MRSPSPPSPRFERHRRRPWGRGVGWRGAVLLGLLGAGLWAALVLRLDPRDLVPGPGGLALAEDFLSRSWRPALTYEAEFVPEGTPPLALKVATAARTTVVFAAAATSIALLGGLLLGCLASTAWWLEDPVGGRGRLQRFFRTSIAPLLYGGTRVLITLMRSLHELLWAVLFLAAFGLSNFAAVLAIAIPYTGTLAKVFSEILDETPREGARALRAAGASPAQVFLFGLFPQALPDLSAYALYRFECALRSSAVLGFFGYPTLGYYLSASFENLHFGEVWTYLYALVGLVLVVDWWSGALRRRFLP